jgi:hypothetical protein
VEESKPAVVGREKPRPPRWPAAMRDAGIPRPPPAITGRMPPRTASWPSPANPWSCPDAPAMWPRPAAPLPRLAAPTDPTGTPCPSAGAGALWPRPSAPLRRLAAPMEAPRDTSGAPWPSASAGALWPRPAAPWPPVAAPAPTGAIWPRPSAPLRRLAAPMDAPRDPSGAPWPSAGAGALWPRPAAPWPPVAAPAPTGAIWPHLAAPWSLSSAPAIPCRGRKGFMFFVIGCVQAYESLIEIRWDRWEGVFTKNTGAKADRATFFWLHLSSTKQGIAFHLKPSDKSAFGMTCGEKREAKGEAAGYKPCQRGPTENVWRGMQRLHLIGHDFAKT